MLFLILFSILYTKFLKKDFKRLIGFHWSFRFIFGIISLIFCIVELTLLGIAELVNSDTWSRSASNFPNWIYVLGLVYIVGYIVFDFIREKRKIKL